MQWCSESKRRTKSMLSQMASALSGLPAAAAQLASAACPADTRKTSPTHQPDSIGCVWALSTLAEPVSDNISASQTTSDLGRADVVRVAKQAFHGADFVWVHATLQLATRSSTFVGRDMLSAPEYTLGRKTRATLQYVGRPGVVICERGLRLTIDHAAVAVCAAAAPVAIDHGLQTGRLAS